MLNILLSVYIIAAIGIIGLVLIQQGKGADAGASFGGGGSSSSMFGASGSGNFLTKSTSVLAIVFFVICLALGNISSQKVDSIFDSSNIEAVQDEVPAVNEAPSTTDEIPN